MHQRSHNSSYFILPSCLDMYKRFTLEELKTVQNTFINNFYSIAKKEYCQMPSDLFKKIFREGNDIYYFNR
ncbi:MAG: hypothetical protein WCJ39_07080 [bacterium]